MTREGHLFIHFKKKESKQIEQVIEDLSMSKDDLTKSEFAVLGESSDEMEPGAVVRLKTYLAARVIIQTFLHNGLPPARLFSEFLNSTPLSDLENREMLKEMGKLIRKCQRGMPWDAFEKVRKWDKRRENPPKK